MKLKEWLFPEECLDYESWEKLYCIKRNVKSKVREKKARVKSKIKTKIKGKVKSLGIGKDFTISG